MTDAFSRRDLDTIELPKQVLARSGTPFRGRWIRMTLPLAVAAVGLSLPWPVAKLAGVVVAAVIFLALPLWVERRLASLERAVIASDETIAKVLLATLERRREVTLFARHGWIALQRGRLHLRLGQGQAAAHSFAEVARLCADIDDPILRGAQAHALLQAGDRKGALQRLIGLEEEQRLLGRDHLNLGILYLEDPGKVARAVDHLQQARTALGAVARVLGGLALAQARSGALEEAESQLEAAQNADPSTDDMAADLIKRARKEIRAKRPSRRRRG